MRHHVKSPRDFIQVVLQHVRERNVESVDFAQYKEDRTDWLDPTKNGNVMVLELIMLGYRYRVNANTHCSVLLDFLKDMLSGHGLIVVGTTKSSGEKVDTENSKSPWRRNLYVYRRPIPWNGVDGVTNANS